MCIVDFQSSVVRLRFLGFIYNNHTDLITEIQDHLSIYPPILPKTKLVAAVPYSVTYPRWIAVLVPLAQKTSPTSQKDASWAENASSAPGERGKRPLSRFAVPAENTR